jgi:inorganic pyrophosphatase
MELHKLPLGDKFPEVCNAVIEIPKGSRNKYEYIEKLGVIGLDRMLYSAIYYPTDYGFFPQTRDEDGDALDVMLLTDSPVFPGCMVEVRPIALMKMIDGGEVDDKILCVATGNPHYSHIQTIDDVDPHTIKEIAHFFETYKLLQKKEVTVEGWFSKEEAYEVMRKCFDAENNK